MPVLIDGYNLYHYAKALYQEDGVALALPAFCRVVAEWTNQSKEKVLMVFDGNVPPPLRQNARSYGPVALEFTGQRCDADTAIELYIARSSAPKLLQVVSTDRRVRTAAKKRGCKVVTSDQFWLKMARKLTRKKAKPEPRENTSGLLSHERDYWLKVFGLE